MRRQIERSRTGEGISRACAQVWRFETRARSEMSDPLGASTRRSAASIGIICGPARTAKVYLIQAALDKAQRDSLRYSLLADPLLEECVEGADPIAPASRFVEVHPLPGVMDPVALTVEAMVRELTGVASVRVMTGVRYDFSGITSDEADEIARRLLANPVIEAIHRTPWKPEQFPVAPIADQRLRLVPIRARSDADLAALSRSAHLFLNLDEMRAIRARYDTLGREPTDIELETLAQTWSEHCVHKTLKSTITYRGEDCADPISWTNRPGHVVNPDGSVTIHNLLRSTIAAATRELIAEGVDWTLSVFVDNAGVIAFDEDTAVCVKVETHNHPSAIEPYGGAATGVGGCIRDIMGTGLGARPIANMDVFCVASPEIADVPAGALHPRRTLERVVAGVRDYGNRMGIPTLNGAVYFDDRYVGNPLVFCGCVGVLPRDKVTGAACEGDRIIALGGRTGRDGIHGATFSSAELEHGHAGEFGHAVQIGNAIEQKRTLDAILRARDHHSGCLYHAITDCGAGGFSSAVGEMGQRLGAIVDLDRAPLKYQGLRYDEVWISESQERMILAVPASNQEALRALCDEEGVEMADLGRFGTPARELILRHAGAEVGRLSMVFLHEGLPMPTREAVWQAGAPAIREDHATRGDLRAHLLRLLARPDIASKRWIIRQYDHEVQGNTIIKPLVGPGGIGPGDAAVIRPVPGSNKGLAIGCGMAVPVGDPALGGDPYLMALAAIDECVRNLVCVGADPERIAILDNFCWPSCEKPGNLATLVRAAEGCYDGAKAYRAPFVSGKDSLNNQFRTRTGEIIEIPPTLLITGIGIVPDLARCLTMELKSPGALLYLIGGGERTGEGIFNPARDAATARTVAAILAHGLAIAAHDCSEGGALVAAAEMLIAAGEGVGLEIVARRDARDGSGSDDWLFAEAPGRYLIEVNRENQPEFERSLGGVARMLLGRVTDRPGMRLVGDGSAASAPACWSLDELRAAFLGALDW